MFPEKYKHHKKQSNTSALSVLVDKLLKRDQYSYEVIDDNGWRV